MNLWDLIKTEGAKYIRDAMPGGVLNPEVTPQGLLDATAVATMPAPVVGDVAGLAADAYRLSQNPEERTAGNFALAGLGLLPFLPGLGTIKNVTPPRMSKAEAEAAGYWHPIGAGKKLPVPVSEMKAVREPVADLTPRRIISPETMQGGVIVPFAGDRSIAGQNLLGVGDVTFNEPVYLEGGYDFMRTHAPTGAIWASEKGAARSLQNRINQAADLSQGGDVFGVYSAMGPESMNFNTMMADSLLEQMKAGKISKKSIAAFDKEVKALRPEWKGVMHPESRAQLESNGALRHVFVDRMQLDKFQNAGFPNIAYTRYAITDPALLDEPMYASGLAIGRMQPGAELITNPLSPHKTYDTQLAGEYAGALDRSVPISVMYPDWYRQRRAMGAPEGGDVRSFQLSKPIQQANQEWLDGLMNYLTRQPAP